MGILGPGKKGPEPLQLRENLLGIDRNEHERKL
jgi:hypothetical protein